MRYTPLFVLIVTYSSFGASQLLGTYLYHFHVIQNKRSTSNVTNTYHSLSATGCARHCLREPGCLTMNFNAPHCELLNEAYDEEFQLVDESDWKFVCKWLSFHNRNIFGVKTFITDVLNQYIIMYIFYALPENNNLYVLYNTMLTFSTNMLYFSECQPVCKQLTSQQLEMK